MTLIRWNPSLMSPHRDLVRLHDEMDRLFDGFVGRTPEQGVFAPPVDIEESSESFVIRADLPGMTQKDVKVSVLGDSVTIRGERHTTQPSNGGTLHRTERVSGMFERTFTLGTAVRPDQVEAKFKDGVLEVRIPKAEDARVREVEIKVG
jgi:HSP20 family protein